MLPKKVNILGQLWDINFVPDLKDKKLRPRLGLCNHDMLKIEVEVNIPLEFKREILLHEIIHAVDSAFALKLSEFQVDKLARGLYGTLARDSIVTEFLFRDSINQLVE